MTCVAMVENNTWTDIRMLFMPKAMRTYGRVKESANVLQLNSARICRIFGQEQVYGLRIDHYAVEASLQTPDLIMALEARRQMP